MAESVELGDLLKRLEKREATERSAFGLFLMTLVMFDIAAALFGEGVGVAIGVPSANMAEAPQMLPWIVIGLHMLLLFFGWSQLGGSGVAGNALTEPNALHLLGAPAPLTARNGQIWAAMVVGFFLLFALLAMSSDVPGSRAGGLLHLASVPLCALAFAAVFVRGYAAAKMLSNRSVLLGGAFGALTVLVVSFLVERGYPSIEMVADHRFLLIEALMLCVAPALLVAIMAREPTSVIGVKTSNAATAPPFVPYDPFDRNARATRYLRFEASNDQLIAFTRGLNAREWTFVCTWDSQFHLPIHDRTLEIWNISYLARQMPQSIEATDSYGLVGISFATDKLTITTRFSGQSFGVGPIAAARNILFQNSDLAGLVNSAAGRALNQRLDEIFGKSVLPDQIDDIAAFLDDKPTSASIFHGFDILNTTRVGDLTAATLHVGIQKVRDYEKKLAERRKDLRRIKRQASDVKEGFGDCWQSQLAADIEREDGSDGQFDAVDTGHALRIIKVIGLRPAAISMRFTGEIEGLEARFDLAEQEIRELLRTAEERHNEVLRTDAQHAMDLQKQLMTPGALTAEQKRVLAARVIGGQLPGGANTALSGPPATPMLPVAAGEEEANGQPIADAEAVDAADDDDPHHLGRADDAPDDAGRDGGDLN